MKRIVALFLLCFIAFSFSGCNDEANRNAIYDDDAAIARSGDNHYSNTSIYSIANNELSMTARTFTGAKTIWHYNAENDGEITFSYLLSVGGDGKAKLVLITPDDEVIILAENVDNTQMDEMQSQTVLLGKGNNRIKIVGYGDPSLTLVLAVDVGELVS